MNAEIISIGSKALSGENANVNAAFVSKKLQAIGLSVSRQTSVNLSIKEVSELLEEAIERSTIVITIGGCGPKDTSVINHSIGSVLDIDIVQNPIAKNMVTEYVNSNAVSYENDISDYTYMPIESQPVKNDFGMFCGVILRLKKRLIIMLPDGENELPPMMVNHIIPYIANVADIKIATESVRTFGISKKNLTEKLESIFKGSNPSYEIFEKNGEMCINISASADKLPIAIQKCNSAVIKIRSILGSDVYGIGDTDLIYSTVDKIRHACLKIATAESCTGGLLSEWLTSIPGASEFLELGICAYSNRIKTDALGVSEDTIKIYGAVSRQTAAEMAVSIKQLSGASIGIAITGVAGPERSENKDIGTVYVSITDGEYIWVRKLSLSEKSSREYIRCYSALTALDLVRRYIDFKPSVMPGGTKLGEKVISMKEQPKYITETVSHKRMVTARPEFIDLYNELLVVEDDTHDDLKTNPQQNAETQAMYEQFNDFYSYNDNNNNDTKDNDLDVLQIPKSYKDNGLEYNIEEITDFTPPEEIDLKTGKVKKITIDNKRSIPYRFIAGALSVIIVILTFGFLIINHYKKEEAEENLIKEARAYFHDNAFNSQDYFYTLNNDYIGWLQIDQTNIDYPVYSSGDDEFYKNHNMNKEKSKYGAIHLYNNSNSNSKNMVITGNRLRNGMMFGSLKKFKDINYFKEHPLISFYSGNKSETYLIAAVYLTNIFPEEDNGKVFEYDKSEFASGEEFDIWIQTVKERNWFVSDLAFNYSDKYITLTVKDTAVNNAQLVVFAKKIESSLDLQAILRSYKVNKNAVPPAAWKTGGTNFESENTEESDLKNDETTETENSAENENQTENRGSNSNTSNTNRVSQNTVNTQTTAQTQNNNTQNQTQNTEQTTPENTGNPDDNNANTENQNENSNENSGTDSQPTENTDDTSGGE